MVRKKKRTKNKEIGIVTSAEISWFRAGEEAGESGFLYISMYIHTCRRESRVENRAYSHNRLRSITANMSVERATVRRRVKGGLGLATAAAVAAAWKSRRALYCPIKRRYFTTYTEHFFGAGGQRGRQWMGKYTAVPRNILFLAYVCMYVLTHSVKRRWPLFFIFFFSL